MLPKTTIYFSFLILVSSTIKASFIKQVSENIFEWRIEEHGTNFTQRIEFDEENGFVISYVPAHNGRMETTFYNDETNGFVLEIIKSKRIVTISKAFMGQTILEQKSVLKTLAQQEDSNDRLVANPETVGPAIELIDIPSSAIDSKCIPEKYRKLIPKGYTIHLMHQVQKFERRNLFHDKDDPSKFTVYDPVSQSNYTVGDDVDEVFSHVFDGILPPVKGTKCPYSFSKRRAKRATTCYDENLRQFTGRCGRVIRGECTACRSTDVGYDCTDGGSLCVWTIKCTNINHKECIKHFVSSHTISCNPCCLVRGCDGNKILRTGSGSEEERKIMGTCSGLPGDEICPLAGTGCPIEDVRQVYTGLMKKENCFIDHQRCRTVYDSRGDLRNTGVHCNPIQYEIPHSTFCCKNKDENLRHNLPTCA